MTFLRLLNRIYLINKIFGFTTTRKKRLSKREYFNISMNKIAGYINNIKHSNSLSAIVKNFDDMNTELNIAIKVRPFFEKINISGYDFKKISDLENVEQLKKEFIKVYLFEKIELELKKNESTTNRQIKESYIKKSLHLALKSVEFLPNDTDFKCKIGELEGLLNNLHNKK